MNELETAKEYIQSAGPTRVAKETGLSRRALQYIINSKKSPHYSTLAAILKAQRKAKA